MIASGVFALPFDDSAGYTAPPAFGPFRVLHQIGSGALGPVFRTFEPGLERLVAVKAFRLDVVPEVTSLLADHLRRLAATPVKHGAVVAVVDAGLEGMTAFLASEYVAAETLDVSLRRLAPARIEVALPLLRQMAEAIEAAWATGLGHGALHPRDIFVLSGTSDATPGRSEIRVAGFGVVPALEALGIPAPARRPYSAPERADGGPWDIRADVYSLGVIAHELLAGRRPAGTAELDGELPTGMSPEQRVAIRRVLSGALVADPARRFPTPTAFVEALTTGDPPDVAVVADAPAGRAVEAPVAAQPPPEPPPEPELDSVPEVVAEPRFAPAYTSVREPFGALPRPAPASDRGVIAGMLALTLIVGTGFGYWLRGPAATAETDDPPVAAVIDDGPIGTEVSVAEAARPAQGAPPVVAAVPAPAARGGRLLVRSVPAGATVSINGRVRGTTPATIRDLPFGAYNIAVSRPGYQRGAQRITMSRTAPAREVTIELTATAPSVPRASTGSVYVVTRPAGATVLIDGRAVGTTPMRVPELAPGPHTVRVDLAGHKSVSTTVVVRAGQQASVRVSLEVQ